MKRLTSAGLIALTVALAPATHAQYTADFQTNIISGVTSNWSGDYYVGNTNFADVLLVENGGTLTDFEGYLGYEISSSNNAAVIVDAGTFWNNSALYVGYSGTGNRLVISNGAQVNAAKGYVGYTASSSGNVAVVTGTGSVWRTTAALSSLRIGLAGSKDNSLTISNGGWVVGFGGSTGGGAGGGTNTVIVTGSGSLWTNRGSTIIGEGHGPSRLEIRDGGQVVDRDGIVGQGGVAGPSASMGNTALVTGSGSSWKSAQTMIIGSAFWGFNNSLVISNGGQVIDSTGTIGETSDCSNNTVLVTSAGSVWNNQSTLYVGNLGRSNSVIVAGGSLFATNVVIGAASTACDNLLRLDSGNVTVTNATTNGVFEVRRGKFVLNGGTLQVDQFVMTNSCAQFIRTGGTLIYGTAVLTANLDADGDGMANGWEQASGLDPLNAADADADTDDDGFTNLQEFQAGTNPTNNSSVFRVLSLESTNDDILVTWQAGGGRTNVVQSASDLTPLGAGQAGSYTNVSPNILLTGSSDVTTNYLDTGAATNGVPRFYRVRLVP